MEKRQPYPTDLTEQQWNRIEPLIPAVKPGGRPAKYPRREIVSAIFYQMRGGSAWRMLPHDLPPWKITYHYFRVWRKDGDGNGFTINCEEMCGKVWDGNASPARGV